MSNTDHNKRVKFTFDVEFNITALLVATPIDNVGHHTEEAKLAVGGDLGKVKLGTGGDDCLVAISQHEPHKHGRRVAASLAHKLIGATGEYGHAFCWVCSQQQRQSTQLQKCIQNI